MGYDKNDEYLYLTDFPVGRDWQASAMEGLNWLAATAVAAAEEEQRLHAERVREEQRRLQQEAAMEETARYRLQLQQKQIRRL